MTQILENELFSPDFLQNNPDYHSAKLVPDLQRRSLCGMWILLIDQGSIRKALLIHSRQKAQEMCQKLLVPHQAVCDFRPVVEDGVVSAQICTPFVILSFIIASCFTKKPLFHLDKPATI